MTTVRINKRIADLGLASRREADELITAGKVTVNGKPAKVGQQVSEKDRVELVGAPETRHYLAYYKGRGVITHSPAQDETDIATMLKKQHKLEGVSPIGRLDKDSEGLILLSNDGRITGPLLDPESAIEKEYEVRVDKPIKSQFLKQMTKGVNIEGYQTKPTQVHVKSKNPTNKTFRIVLTEGKKHQIRRMCAALGYQVQGLKRIRIANIELGKLKPNQFRHIKGKELHSLLNTLQVS